MDDKKKNKLSLSFRKHENLASGDKEPTLHNSLDGTHSHGGKSQAINGVKLKQEEISNIAVNGIGPRSSSLAEETSPGIDKCMPKLTFQEKSGDDHFSSSQLNQSKQTGEKEISSPVVSEDSNRNIFGNLKRDYIEIIPSNESSIHNSEQPDSCTPDETALLKSPSTLSCFDNLFDPSIVSPLDSYESGPNASLSPQDVRKEKTDVHCWTTLPPPSLLNQKEGKDTLEFQPTSQGLFNCKSLAKVPPVNGLLSHINILPSDSSCEDNCVQQGGGVTISSNDEAFPVDHDTPLCDATVHSISKNLTTDSSLSYENLSLNDDVSINGNGRTLTDVRAVTGCEKENAQRSDVLSTALDMNRQLSDSSKRKAPRAKKSCGGTAKIVKAGGIQDETAADSPILHDDDSKPDCMSDNTSGSHPRPTLSSMTIKLPELENVLGIRYKSLDKMDAKTLDRIVLAKAQQKMKSESDCEKPPILDEVGNCIGSSNGVSDSEKPMVLSRSCDKETIRETDVKENGILNWEESEEFSTASYNVLPSHEKAVQDGRDAVQSKTFLVGHQKNNGTLAGSESRDRPVCKNAAEKENVVKSCAVDDKDSCRSGFSSVNLSNKTIFKAKKSQGYAFGRVKRCREILNASCASDGSLQLGATSARRETSNATLLPSKCSSPTKINKDLSFPIQNKARKQAAASPASGMHRFSGNTIEAENGTGIKRPHRKRSFDGHFSSSSSLATLSEPKRKSLKCDDSFPVPQMRPPIKSVVSKFDLGAGHDFEKQDRLERASLSSSSSADRSAYQNDSEVQRHLSLKCCCEQPVALNVRHLTKCQGLESSDAKVVGCTGKWTNGKLVRPSTRIPFMAMCDKHYKLLLDHRCCPGCGQFCIQGEFYQCKQSGKTHMFHRHCQIFHDNRHLCPHCGVECAQQSVVLQASDLHLPGREDRTQKRFSKLSQTARLGGCSNRKGQRKEGSVSSLSFSESSQADDFHVFGVGRQELEASLSALSAAAKEKLKRIRPCAKSFFAACKNGELEKVLYMIGEGIDPNLRLDDFSESCLHIAARHGHKEIVKLLLQAGVLPNSLDLRLHTPMMAATIKGHLDVLEVLVKAGGSLNFKASDGMTVLHLAAKTGQLDIIHCLLENYQLDVNVKDDGGWTPVIWATEYTHVSAVKYLLGAGANPNIQDNELNTGLHWAAFAGSTDISKLFLDYGCDIECSNERGDRPLHIASRQNHYECVSMFLMRGADASVINKDGLTPIECCPVKDSSTRLNLALKKMLQQSSAGNSVQPERLVHEDVSLGRESNPITVVNGVDGCGVPNDFIYVSDYVETIPININRVITSLRTCDCKNDCVNINCNCMRSCIKSWYDKNGRLTEEFNYPDPPLVYECNRGCRCFTSCQNRVVQNGITCRLQLFRTKGRGWGCRTLLSIEKGSFVCEYFGELISDAEADRRQDDSYLFDLDNQEMDTFCVDAARYGNVSRFINHLCEPNVTPVKVFVDHQDQRFPRMCFFANRDIKANEELGFDYGDKFWVIKYKDFTCDCGSPKCRYSVTTIGKTLDDFKRRQEEEACLATSS